MSISRNWPQLCLDNISDKEENFQRFVSSSNFLPALGGKIPFDGNKETSKVVSSSNFLPALGGKIPFDGNKETSKGVSSSNFLPALGGKIPFDGNKETSKVCFLIKLLTSTWR